MQVAVEMLKGGRPLRAVWRTPLRYGLPSPRDGAKVTIVGEPVPRGETGTLWVDFVLTPTHGAGYQTVDCAPIECFVLDNEAIDHLLIDHFPELRAEVVRRVSEAREAHRRQKARDLSAMLRAPLCVEVDPHLCPPEYRDATPEDIFAHPVVAEELREVREGAKEAEDALVEALKVLRAFVDGCVEERPGFRVVSYTLIDAAKQVLGD
jgi:hypothetical protein